MNIKTMDAAVSIQKRRSGACILKAVISGMSGFTLSVYLEKRIRLNQNAGDRKQMNVQTADREQINRQAERIMDEYGNSILRLAYSYLHNMLDSEEILQETLLTVLKTAPVFENAMHEKAWIMRVTGNLSKNRIAYNKVRSADELNDSFAADQREDLSFVWEAVKTLPLKYREVIHLFYQEDCTTQQIAQILGLKEATVRSHLHRGRKKLKEILKEEYDFA